MYKSEDSLFLNNKHFFHNEDIEKFKKRRQFPFENVDKIKENS